jgi:hypothetical protein
MSIFSVTEIIWVISVRGTLREVFAVGEDATARKCVVLQMQMCIGRSYWLSVSIVQYSTGAFS